MVAAYIGGCATGPPRPQTVAPVRSASQLLQIASSGYGGLQNIEARADVVLRIDGVRQKASAVLLFRSPGDLKFDVAGPLGIALLSGRVRNDTLQLYLPRENQILIGDPAETLYRVTGVNLAYYELRRAILGLPNLSPLLQPHVTGFRITPDAYFMDINTFGWIRRLQFDRATARLREERIVDELGFELSRRTLADYRDEQGVVLPRRIRILQGVDLFDIHVTRRRVNIEVSEIDDRFRMRVPSGVTRILVQDPTTQTDGHPLR